MFGGRTWAPGFDPQPHVNINVCLFQRGKTAEEREREREGGREGGRERERERREIERESSKAS